MESNKVNIQDTVNQISELCNKLGVILIGVNNVEGIDAEIEVIPLDSPEIERRKKFIGQQNTCLNFYNNNTLPNEMIDYLPNCYAQIGNV